MNRPKYGEIKAYDNTKERNRCEELADLYAIIRTTESLEAVFARDAVTLPEYSESCTKLISQYKTTEAALVAAGGQLALILYYKISLMFSNYVVLLQYDNIAIRSGELFFKEFKIECPRAFERLVRTGTYTYSSILHHI